MLKGGWNVLKMAKLEKNWDPLSSIPSLSQPKIFFFYLWPFTYGGNPMGGFFQFFHFSRSLLLMRESVVLLLIMMMMRESIVS